MMSIWLGLAILVGQWQWSVDHQIKAVTYNIRYHEPNDGKNAWPKRKGRVAELLLAQQADIIGLQEALDGQVVYCDSVLNAFGRVGVGRDDGKQKGEFSPLYYRQSRFDLADHGTFWLSETPEVPGSKSWDAAITRICTYAKLLDKQSGKPVWVFNTHFDHKGKVAREESAKLLVRKAHEMAKEDAVLLIGDFNFPPESDPYGTMVAEFEDSFSCYTDGEKTTSHGFAVGENEGNRIDHIFHSAKLACLYYRILDDNDGENYPSDHLPVVSVLMYRD